MYSLGGAKIHICKTVYFDQLLDFQIHVLLLLFLYTLLMRHILLFGCTIFFNTIRVSNSLDPDQARLFLGLIWVQTVCKGYQQTTELSLVGKKLNTKQLVDTTFWLKSISFGSNFFHLAKVLVKTNSEPGLALMYLGIFVGVLCWSLFYYASLCVLSIFVNTLTRKRIIVALL